MAYNHDDPRLMHAQHMNYERAQGLPERSRDPTPSTSRSYTPYADPYSPGMPPYRRDEYAVPYRPNHYPPSRQPSWSHESDDERYYPPRGREINETTAWRSESVDWPRPPPPPGDWTYRDTRMRESPTNRAFEPSASWRHTHREDSSRAEDPYERSRPTEARRPYPDHYEADYYPNHEYRGDYHREAQAADGRGPYGAWQRAEDSWENYRGAYTPERESYESTPWLYQRPPPARERTLSNASHRAPPISPPAPPRNIIYSRDATDPAEGSSRTPGSGRPLFEHPRKRLNSRSSSMSSDISRSNAKEPQGSARAPRAPLAAQADLFAYVRQQAGTSIRERGHNMFPKPAAVNTQLPRPDGLTSSPRSSNETTGPAGTGNGLPLSSHAPSLPQGSPPSDSANQKGVWNRSDARRSVNGTNTWGQRPDPQSSSQIAAREAAMRTTPDLSSEPSEDLEERPLTFASAAPVSESVSSAAPGHVVHRDGGPEVVSPHPASAPGSSMSALDPDPSLTLSATADHVPMPAKVSDAPDSGRTGTGGKQAPAAAVKATETRGAEKNRMEVVTDPHPRSASPTQNRKSHPSAMPADAKVSKEPKPLLARSPLQELPQDSGAGEASPPTNIDPRTMAEALRYVVWKRLHVDFPPKHIADAQVRNPVIMANREKVKDADVDALKRRETTDVVAEVMARSEARQQATYPRAASSLAQYFAQKEEMLDAKIKRLREEYLALHVKWVQQCSKLETAPKIVAPPPEELPAAPTGRTTRRSAATLGDAVRSDLELEQIISTLGNEDMLDPSILCLRNVAKIPDMISATHGQVEASFDDTNNLVDNPGDFYAPRSGFEDWTDEEKEIFNEKYAAHPKQFGIIADFLPHKTPSQCVAYYYLHKKKLIDFRKVITHYAPTKRKRGGKGTGKQKGNALLTDIRRHDAEVSVRKTRGRKTEAPATSRRKSGPLEDTPVSTPTPEPEGKTRRRRTAPTSRAVAVGQDQEDGDEEEPEARPAKRGRKPGRKPKAVPTSAEPTPPPAEKSKSRKKKERQRDEEPAWYQESREDLEFIQLLQAYGKDFELMSEHAREPANKTVAQLKAKFEAGPESYEKYVRTGERRRARAEVAEKERRLRLEQLQKDIAEHQERVEEGRLENERSGIRSPTQGNDSQHSQIPKDIPQHSAVGVMVSSAGEPEFDSRLRLISQSTFPSGARQYGQVLQSGSEGSGASQEAPPSWFNAAAVHDLQPMGRGASEAEGKNDAFTGTLDVGLRSYRHFQPQGGDANKRNQFLDSNTAIPHAQGPSMQVLPPPFMQGPSSGTYPYPGVPPSPFPYGGPATHMPQSSMTMFGPSGPGAMMSPFTTFAARPTMNPSMFRTFPWYSPLPPHPSDLARQNTTIPPNTGQPKEISRQSAADELSK